MSAPRPPIDHPLPTRSLSLGSFFFCLRTHTDGRVPSGFTFVMFSSRVQMKLSECDTALFASQPDLLNFKKGWMSKLDESGEVRLAEAACGAFLRHWLSTLSLEMSYLFPITVTEAVVACCHIWALNLDLLCLFSGRSTGSFWLMLGSSTTETRVQRRYFHLWYLEICE